MLEVPMPSADNIMWFLAGLLVGLPAPYWYASERIQGFSRSMLSRLPYQPPPGKSEDEAMEEAVQEGDP